MLDFAILKRRRAQLPVIVVGGQEAGDSVLLDITTSDFAPMFTVSAEVEEESQKAEAAATETWRDTCEQLAEMMDADGRCAQVFSRLEAAYHGINDSNDGAFFGGLCRHSSGLLQAAMRHSGGLLVGVGSALTEIEQDTQVAATCSLLLSSGFSFAECTGLGAIISEARALHDLTASSDRASRKAHKATGLTAVEVLVELGPPSAQIAQQLSEKCKETAVLPVPTRNAISALTAAALKPDARSACAEAWCTAKHVEVLAPLAQHLLTTLGHPALAAARKWVLAGGVGSKLQGLAVSSAGVAFTLSKMADAADAKGRKAEGSRMRDLGEAMRQLAFLVTPNGAVRAYIAAGPDGACNIPKAMLPHVAVLQLTDLNSKIDAMQKQLDTIAKGVEEIKGGVEEIKGGVKDLKTGVSDISYSVRKLAQQCDRSQSTQQSMFAMMGDMALLSLATNAPESLPAGCDVAAAKARLAQMAVDAAAAGGAGSSSGGGGVGRDPTISEPHTPVAGQSMALEVHTSTSDCGLGDAKLVRRLQAVSAERMAADQQLISKFAKEADQLSADLAQKARISAGPRWAAR